MISSIQLAKICRVSQGTVDRALHNRPGIGESTRRRILATAKKYGYRPNPAARELMGRPGSTVGAIVPAFNSVFFMDLMNVCREKLAEAGLRLMLTPVNRREDFLETLEDFAARKMMAAFVVPPEDNITIPQTVTANMPVLSFLSPCKGKNVFLIAPDDIQTGRDAVDYLTSRGHERILHVTYARCAKAIRDRLNGYRRRMIELGRKPAVHIVHTGDGLYTSLIRHRPTAVFCHNDWLALSAIQTLRDHGKNVPADVSVLGVDNSPTFVALYPNLTTMEFPVDQVAANVCAKIKDPAATITLDRFKIIERATVTSLKETRP